ncbi:hypothetical protein [Kitasatospora sp. NBC_01302]|uniref:hypothetical protein n=1 Tax=Kitasatospora sp. NBC_01302 TaxID=2903575 RepID=UPI002E1577E5|nr:hypothetical protein OG294_12810 [Kitasatospora sp. NBC_01302]
MATSAEPTQAAQLTKEPAGAAQPAAGQPAQPVPSGPAAVLAAVGFGLLMVFLGVLGWDGNSQLPSMAQTAPGLVAALLGAVINPGHTVRQPVWSGLATCALLAAGSAGLAVLVDPRHPDAVPALTASVAAFAGLFVNTSKITHASG